MTTLKEPLQRPRLGAAEGELEQATTKRNRRTYLALLLPGLLGLLVSFVFPLAYLVRMSFNKGGT
ncbi:hypothetical protein AAHB34_20665 [Paenarthrobacter ureafaciens]